MVIIIAIIAVVVAVIAGIAAVILKNKNFSAGPVSLTAPPPAAVQ